MFYRIKMWLQRRTRGFDDYEVFTFEQSLARFLYKRLERTIKKKRSIGYEVTLDWDKTAAVLKEFAEDDGDKFTYDRDFRNQVKSALNFIVEKFGNLSY